MLSERSNITPVANLLVQADPKSVLDVGVGFGTYGYIARAFLDVWRGRMFKKDWKAKIDGIEFYKEFENPIYSFCYDRVFFGNVLEILPKLEKYDMIIFMHILEHMEKFRAIEVIELASKHANKRIIIGTPMRFFKTGYENWPAEQHRCHFTPAELQKLHFKIRSQGDLGILAWRDL